MLKRVKTSGSKHQEPLARGQKSWHIPEVDNVQYKHYDFDYTFSSKDPDPSVYIKNIWL